MYHPRSQLMNYCVHEEELLPHNCLGQQVRELDCALWHADLHTIYEMKYRLTDILTYRWTHWHTDWHTKRHTDTQTDIQTYRLTHWHTDWHTGKHTDIQADKQTDIQTEVWGRLTYSDRLAYKHTYWHTNTLTRNSHHW